MIWIHDHSHGDESHNGQYKEYLRMTKPFIVQVYWYQAEPFRVHGYQVHVAVCYLPAQALASMGLQPFWF